MPYQLAPPSGKKKALPGITWKALVGFVFPNKKSLEKVSPWTAKLCPRVCQKCSHKLGTAIVRACLWVCSDEKGFSETRRPTIPIGSPFWRGKKHYKNLD